MTSGREFIQRFDDALALGTLASKTAVTGATLIDSSRLQGVRIKWMKGIWLCANKTVNEGPIEAGFVAGKLSAAEIQEHIEADPQSRFDTEEQQEAQRNIYPQVYIPNGLTEAPYDPNWHVPRWEYMDGFPKRIHEGEALNMYAYNHASAGSLTTGAVVTFFGIAGCEWIDE